MYSIKIKEKALGLYKGGLSLCQVGKKLNISEGVVNLWTNEAGITRSLSDAKITEGRVVDIKINQLSKQELEWWLGFMFADGHIGKKNNKGCHYIGCVLQQQDKDVLEKINKIYYKMGIKTTIRSCVRKNGRCYVYLSISAKKLWEFLVSKGMIDGNRIGKMIFPEWAKKSSDFMRGFFCGDGSFVKCKKVKLKYIAKFFSTSKSFVEEIYNILIENNISCRINCEDNRQGNRKPLYRLIINQCSLIDFINFIYQDSTPNTRMNRKYELAQRILREV